MSRFRLFYLRNGMLVANFLGNFVAVAFVQTLFLKAEAPADESIWENPFLDLFDSMFTPVAFLFVLAMTLIYERPIRQYLTAMMEQSCIAGDLKMKARRRLGCLVHRYSFSFHTLPATGFEKFGNFLACSPSYTKGVEFLLPTSSQESTF